jgi:hypothetical protein
MVVYAASWTQWNIAFLLATAKTLVMLGGRVRALTGQGSLVVPPPLSVMPEQL